MDYDHTHHRPYPIIAYFAQYFYLQLTFLKHKYGLEFRQSIDLREIFYEPEYLEKKKITMTYYNLSF